MSNPAPTTAPAVSARRQWVGLGVLCLATLLVALDLFVMLLAVPAVTAALGASSTEQLWILDVYGFMVAGLMITMGNLADRIGRRRLLLVAAALFGVASVVAAYSTSPDMLIAMRAVLGLAGAAIAPCTLGLISNLFPDERHRATAYGIWGGCFTVGAVVGPIVGGVLLNHFWWGAAFLIGVPAMVILLVAGPILLPEYRDPAAGRIDLVSVLLSLAAILPAIHGLKQIASHGLGTVEVAALVAGAVFGWLFVRRQRRLPDPLVDVQLFTRKTFSVLVGSMLGYSMLSGGTMVLIAQYFQLVQGLTPLEAGLALVPGMVTSAISFQIAPLLARRIRPGILIAAGVALTAGGMYVISTAISTPVIVIAFAVEAIGAAPLVTLGMSLTISAAPPEKAGSVSALAQTSNEMGYSLGIAVLGSVLTAVYLNRMDGAGGNSLAEAISKGVEPQLLTQARDAFTSGFHVTALITAVALTVMGTLLYFTLRSVPVLKQH